MGAVYLNKIATAVPEHDIHRKFVSYAPHLLSDLKSRKAFARMADRSQIEHRYSFFKPHPDPDKLDSNDFYNYNGFPDTESRMSLYKQHAFNLAKKALDQLDLTAVTHLIVTSCTGFYAPGLDFYIVKHYGLDPSIERTTIGFMGCFAAFNGLKTARHIVRSDETAKVLMVNLELCTLHLQQSHSIEQMLSFLIFADGCAASLISSDPAGLEIQSFRSCLLPETSDYITWDIGNTGFVMELSGRVPGIIASNLPKSMDHILEGHSKEEIMHWAIHPGGRSILDAVRDGAELQEEQIAISRDILRRFGNMSSASIMFVLNEMMESTIVSGPGCAMAFGPGLTIETMRFVK